MPELPEVETTARDLRQKVLHRVFFDVWTDTPKIIQKPKNFNRFRKQIKGKKIRKVWRWGKNIIFDLSKGKSLLVHQKITGHLLVGKWSKEIKGWRPIKKGPLEDKTNAYIRVLFWFDNGQMLALSDLRKFAKVELWDGEKLKKELDSSLGVEPLEKDFTFNKFKNVLKGKKSKIGQVLMDQKNIVGIGNIYSNEILWDAKIYPFRAVNALGNDELQRIFKAIKKILKKAIQMRGTSTADYRDAAGKKGFFEEMLKVYQKEGQKCSRCKNIIARKKMGTRSAHFCPKCQNL